MKVAAEFHGTDAVDLTIAITMSLRDWKTLREQIKQSAQFQWPSSQLRKAITDAVSQIEDRIMPTITED